MNKQRLMVIKAIVRRILEEDPAARDSDEYLYMRVCEEVNPGAVLKSFRAVWLHLPENGLPPFESVRRSRQSVQQMRPDLGSSAQARLTRRRSEQAYYLFSRDDKNQGGE